METVTVEEERKECEGHDGFYWMDSCGEDDLQCMLEAARLRMEDAISEMVAVLKRLKAKAGK